MFKIQSLLIFLFFISILTQEEQEEHEENSNNESKVDRSLIYTCENHKNPNKLDDCGTTKFGVCCYYELKVKESPITKECITNPFPRYAEGGNQYDITDTPIFTPDSFIDTGINQLLEQGFELEYVYVYCPGVTELDDDQFGSKCGNDYEKGSNGKCYLRELDGDF